MDESLKKKIYWSIITFLSLLLVISLIGNYRVTKQIDEDYISVNRSPLEPFRLVEYKETSDGAFIDVVSVHNGKKYENNFISKTCPLGKEKKIGLIMQLSVVENVKTSTNETFYTLDRAYQYLCTNLNMKDEDERLFKRIKEARDRLQSEVIIKKGSSTPSQ